MDQEMVNQIQRQLEEEAARRFPAGLIRAVAVLQPGDDPPAPRPPGPF